VVVSGDSHVPPEVTAGGARVEVTLLLFASARQEAGTSRVEVEGHNVAEVLDIARGLFGAGFAGVLEGSRVWVNGEPAVFQTPLAAGDEVAVLPPVSGG
jgi:molybdopterin converting factor small subunit